MNNKQLPKQPRNSYGLPVGFAAISLLAAITFHTQALADCVDFSEARHKVAAKALAKNPPKFADLGFPEIANLTLDAEKSSGDPKCDPSGSKQSHFFYKTNMSRLAFYKAVFPYMKPWHTWINPAGGNSHNFILSSGSEVAIWCQGGCKEEEFDTQGKITEIKIDRRNNKSPLSTDGPGWNWTPEDLAKGSGEPASGRADKERPDAQASNKPAASNSSSSSGNSTSDSNNPQKVPSDGDTVNDTLDKAKKLKDLLKF